MFIVADWGREYGFTELDVLCDLSWRATGCSANCSVASVSGGSNRLEDKAGRFWDFSYADEMVCGRWASGFAPALGGFGQVVQVELAEGVLSEGVVSSGVSALVLRLSTSYNRAVCNIEYHKTLASS